MTRRFITAEDVRRARGGELVIDESTVVTPQAAAAAEASGVVLRTASGAYVTPAPDRGPDAAVAARVLPNMPEPGRPGEATGAIVTAVGRNRSGVLAEITSALGELGVSIGDISQKMVQGYFHLVLTLELPAGQSLDVVRVRLEALGGSDDYAVQVMHERIFRFMHRV
ncbi:MAG: ACT domain-containing protein [Planctomycetota bacterium]|jgi:ACT domain-containing protein